MRFHAVPGFVREGDPALVAMVDRASRNIIEFLSFVAAQRDRGVDVRSLRWAFDSAARYRIVMHLDATFAENEGKVPAAPQLDSLPPSHMAAMLGCSSRSLAIESTQWRHSSPWTPLHVE